MRSLSVKFAVTTISIMLVSSLFAFMFSNFYYQQKLKPENDKKNTAIALNIVDYIESKEDMNLEHYLESLSSVGYQLFVINEEGEEKFYGEPFREKILPTQTKQFVLNGEIYHGIAEFPRETFITGFFANELTNTIGVPFYHHDQQYGLFIRPSIKMLFSEMHILFAWLLALTIILSIILVLISTRFLTKPISELTAATKDLSKGNFSIKLDIGRGDEIGELSKSFTNMANQLEKLDEMKNEFISNISHDIKSPLSNIKGYSNLLEKNTLSEAEKSHYMTVINNEIDRLSSLTHQLLLLASLEHQDEILEKTTYSLSEQIKEVILNHQWLINQKGIMVSYSLPDVQMHGDFSMLYNVWENLLTNAIKYNKEDGSIDVLVIENEKDIKVSFKDTGIGFSDKVKERIFDSFYREDSARTNTIEGTGLGLSIVIFIVELHEGHISVESKENQGSTFIVHLPKKLDDKLE